MTELSPNRCQKDQMDGQALHARLKFTGALKEGRCLWWPSRIWPCIVLLSLAAILLCSHYELPAQRPWIQLRVWQAQIASFVFWGSKNKMVEMLPSNAEMQIDNSSIEQGDTKVENEKSPDKSRVAVCLVGGARAFELTGPSIKKHLLQANNMDVFLHAPLDKDAYKFSLLKDVLNLVHVRIFTPKRIPQTRLHAELLTASGSPNGVQGLLQYFNLVEGCLQMIEAHQSRFNFTYQWIVRTRVDSFWNAPLPPLKNLKFEAYTVPVGSQFGGLNDRLGIGNWENSKVALSRITSLPLLHSKGFRRFNSETAFKFQLKVGNVKAVLRSFPFCILSHRSYSWPLTKSGVPVLSISSKAPMNGAKCRPCTPGVTGKKAKRILETQWKSWAWTGQSDGMELCDARHDWETNWREIFDNIVSPKFVEVRKRVENETLKECIKEIEELQEHAEIWDSPSPPLICNKAFAL